MGTLLPAWTHSACTFVFFVCVSVFAGTEIMVFVGLFSTMLWPRNWCYANQVCVFLLDYIWVQLVLIVFLIFNMVLPYFVGTVLAGVTHSACTFVFVFAFFVCVCVFGWHIDGELCFAQLMVYVPAMCFSVRYYSDTMSFNCIYII